MTVVRRAFPRDVPRLVEMGRRFLRESGYGARIAENPDRIGETMAGLIASPDAAVFVGEDGTGQGPVGMVAVFCYVHPWSGERVATELVWWVEPEARGRLGLALLRAAEAWAAAQQARCLQMIAPTEDVARIYRRRGYTAVEATFQKAV